MLPKVLVGIPTSHVAAGFVETLQFACELEPSEGYASYPVVIPGRVTNQARNILAARMLEGDWTHLFMLDDDMTYPRGTLARLLQADKDIISPFYVRKVRGFLPNCFKDEPPNGWQTYWCDELEQVAAVGTGGILIKRDVFETMEPPWFVYEPYDHPSEHVIEQKSEDVVFCEKAREAGFEIWCEGRLKCGHIGEFIVTPGLAVDGQPGVGSVKVEPVEATEENDYGY